MTTAPYRSQHLAGVRSVFSLPASASGHPRPVGVAALLNAVHAVAGVRDAELRTAAGGDRTLHLDLVDGADEAAVAWSVTRILDERLGVEVDQTRSVLVDDGVDEARSVPLDGPQRRVHLERLQVVTGGLDVRVDVALATAQARVVGSASGPAVERTVLRTVAGATLNAVDALLEGRARCGLDQAELTDIGSDRLAIAVVTLLTPGQVDRLAGAALVRGDARQAMVRAVLSALNRRFESLLAEHSSNGWAASFPPASFPQSVPLAVENTATFRTIGGAPDGLGGAPDGLGGDPDGLGGDPDEAEPLVEPAVEVTAGLPTIGEDYPAADPPPADYPPAERGGRAARRAAAAAAHADEPTQRTTDEPTYYGTIAGQPLRGGYRAEQSFPAEPLINPPAAHPDYASAGSLTGDPTAERPVAADLDAAATRGPGDPAAEEAGPNGSADLGDWAAATWARLVRNDVTKGAQAPEAKPVSPAAPAASLGGLAANGRTSTTGTFGAVSPTGSFPLVSPTGSFPLVSSTGAFPTVGNGLRAVNGHALNGTSPVGSADANDRGGRGAEPEPEPEPSITTSGVFTPPAEPTYTPPAEPTWSWPSSGGSSQTGSWASPRWEQPAVEEPRQSTRNPRDASQWDVPRPQPSTASGPLPTTADAPRNGYPRPSSHLGPLALTSGAGAGNPLSRGNNGASATGSLGRGGLNGSYLEREYGGMGVPPRRAERTDQTGRSEAGRGQSGPIRPTSPASPSGWGRHGREASGPLPLPGQPASGPAGYGPPTSGQPSYGSGPPGYGQPTSGQPSYGQPTSGPAGYGQPTSGQPGYGSGQPGYGQPTSGPAGYGQPTSGQPSYGQPTSGFGQPPLGAGPAPAGRGSAGGAVPPRRRHAAADTGTWPIQDPPAPTGPWADPLGTSAQPLRDPSAADRSYRNGSGPVPGEYPDRRDPQPPHTRRRYADEEAGRHGGGR